MVVYSFSFFLLVFVAIGVLSAVRNRHTSADYLLAGHSVKPWLVALSAVATNNSGYMFIGLIGYTYTTGLSAMWLMIGWIVGDFIASLRIHKPLRKSTEKRGVLSYAGVLSQWNGTDYRRLRIIGGIITLLFLGTYAAAQLNAGSKALHVLFGWDYSLGAIIGSVMVLLYCFAGGIRASIWTDAAQSFVMVIAMSLMCVMAVMEVGGWSEYITKLDAVSPTFLSIWPDAPWGAALFILGWLFAGFGVIGQPHIMVRFMSMDDPKHMNRVRLYYYSWYSSFTVLAIMTALAARLLLPGSENFDAELALPQLAQSLLPEILVGLVLAGLFAATMSTADSQILSCSAAITRDFTRDHTISYLATKLGTVFITALALTIALSGGQSVFELVVIAWSALGSAFAPLLLIYVLGGKPTEWQGIITMLSGLAAMLAWRALGFNAAIYEIMPGILIGLVVYGLTCLFTPKSSR